MCAAQGISQGSLTDTGVSFLKLQGLFPSTIYLPSKVTRAPSLLIPQGHLPGEKSSSAFLLIPPILSLPLPREVFATNHVASFVVRVIKRTFFISPFSCSRFLSLSVSDKDLFPP